MPTIPTGEPTSREKPQTMFSRECSWTSKNSLVVDDAAAIDVAHVVGLRGVVGDQRVELLVFALDGSSEGSPKARRRLEVIRGQEATSGSAVLEAARPRPRRRSGRRPTSSCGVIAPPSSSNSTSSPVTVLITSGPVMNMCEVSLTIEDEVGHRRRVDRAAGARAHDQADLRDHAGAADVAEEDVAVGAERDHALLDPRAAGVVDPDHRRRRPRRRGP